MFYAIYSKSRVSPFLYKTAQNTGPVLVGWIDHTINVSWDGVSSKGSLSCSSITIRLYFDQMNDSVLSSGNGIGTISTF